MTRIWDRTRRHRSQRSRQIPAVRWCFGVFILIDYWWWNARQKDEEETNKWRVMLLLVSWDPGCVFASVSPVSVGVFAHDWHFIDNLINHTHTHTVLPGNPQPHPPVCHTHTHTSDVSLMASDWAYSFVTATRLSRLCCDSRLCLCDWSLVSSLVINEVIFNVTTVLFVHIHHRSFC